MAIKIKHTIILEYKIFKPVNINLINKERLIIVNG